MDIKAIGDFIILERLEAPDRNGGVLLTPAQQEADSQRPIGVVLSVGSLVNKVDVGQDHDDPIEEGQVVLFCGDKARGVHGRDGAPRWMCRREDIIGRVTRDNVASADQAEKLRKRHDAIREDLERIQSQRNARASLEQTAGLAEAGTRAGLKLHD